MPYSVRKIGSKYQVVKDSNGDILGTHSSRKEAQAQIYAIQKNEKGKGK